MKKIFLFIAILFLLSKTFAQISYYKYEWTQINNKTKFSGIIKLKIKTPYLPAKLSGNLKRLTTLMPRLYNITKDKKIKWGLNM